MALVGVHTADLAWLHDKTRESVHMIGDVPQSPTLQLDGLGVIVADVHVFIWLLAAGAIVEDIDDLDISGCSRGFKCVTWSRRSGRW